LVAERGADGVSLRELARAAGVSHAAPAHHFTDRRGLFTALAAQGWRMLAVALADARPEFSDAALAYVRFAVENPGHYEVMFDRS
ncbi:TetR family transcriptional regulator, partial [Mycobacterium sp. ITM-2017-0098]